MTIPAARALPSGLSHPEVRCALCTRSEDLKLVGDVFLCAGCRGDGRGPIDYCPEARRHTA